MNEKYIVFFVVKFILPAFQGYEEREKTGKCQFRDLRNFLFSLDKLLNEQIFTKKRLQFFNCNLSVSVVRGGLEPF
jgi:hypothetical protein